VLELRLDLGWQSDNFVESVDERSDRADFLDLGTDPQYDVTLVIGWDCEIRNLCKKCPEWWIIANHTGLMGIEGWDLVPRHGEPHVVSLGS
jgi:hypothetical protein